MGTEVDVRADARRVAALALGEDGPRDVTSDVTISAPVAAEGAIEFRTGGVLAGTAYAQAVADACGLAITWLQREGAVVPAGAVAGVLAGDLTSILRAERPLLNLLQRACGIATLTREFVLAVAGTGCRILHTRKTAPGLRTFDLHAVVAGGGGLHRTDLSNAVMVKDNHWVALRRQGRSLAQSLAEAWSRGVRSLYVEVENLPQVEEACRAGATRLLVDNQSPAILSAWAKAARAWSPPIEIEATGGITLANVRNYAEAGADYVSVGAITHSVQAADLAIEVR